MTAHSQPSLATREVLKQTIKENWDRLKKGTLAEANALWQPCMDCLRTVEAMGWVSAINPPL